MLEKTDSINKIWKHSKNLSGVCDVLIFHGAKLLWTVMIIIECTHEFIGRVLRAITATKWFSTWINNQRQGSKYPSKVVVFSSELERLVEKFSYLYKSTQAWNGKWCWRYCLQGELERLVAKFSYLDKSTQPRVETRCWRYCFPEFGILPKPNSPF